MSHLVFIQNRYTAEAAIRDEFLDHKSIHQRQGSDADADKVLRSCQRDQHEGFTSEFHNKELAEENTNNDEDKQIVVRDVAEHVNLVFSELPCVEEVENLQENESIEENTEVNTRLVVPMLLIQAN